MKLNNIDIANDISEKDVRSRLQYLRTELANREKSPTTVRSSDEHTQTIDLEARVLAERQESREIIDRKQSEITVLKQDAAKLELSNYKLEQEIDRLRASNTELERLISAKTAELNEIKSRLNKKTRYADTRQNALESINARVDILHKTIVEKNDEISELQLTINQLNRQLRFSKD